MRIPGADKAIDNLLKWSAKEDWNSFREQVFAEHFDMICDRFDTTKQEIADLLGDSFGMVFGCVLEDFFTARFGDEGEKNVIDDYLRRRGWRESKPSTLFWTPIIGRPSMTRCLILTVRRLDKPQRPKRAERK